MRCLINPLSVRQSALGREQPTYDDKDSGTPETVKGTVIRVYPIGHPDNGLSRMLADVQISRRLPILTKVPIAAGHAHQETEIAAPDTANRNPYAPKERNRIDGSSDDIRPGTTVVVGFMNADFRDPVILRAERFNYQGRLGFPVDKASVYRMAEGGDGGEAAEVYPLDSHMDEYPRSVRTYNGTRREIDNRGNLLEQTTTDRDPVFPGDNLIPASPIPEGDAIRSTRGAVRGNQARLTGVHALTEETNSEGNILDETQEAGLGRIVHRAVDNGDGSRLVELLRNVLGSASVEIEENGQGNYLLTINGNGVGSWLVDIRSNGEGRWNVAIEDNPDGSADMQIKGNGIGSRGIAIEDNGTGDYTVATKANGSGAHKHTSENDVDGSHRRSALDCSDGSVLDRTELCSLGRLDRKSVESDDGTIRDETKDSGVGHVIHRAKGAAARMWSSTRGSADGRVYFEDGPEDDPEYLSLGGGSGRAELHARLNAVMDSMRVSLGHKDAEYNLTLWPQLYDAILLLCTIFDTHTHSGVEEGAGNTLVPNAFQTLSWVTNGPNSRSDVGYCDKDPGPDPTYESDPDEGAPE